MNRRNIFIALAGVFMLFKFVVRYQRNQSEEIDPRTQKKMEQITEYHESYEARKSRAMG